MIFSYVYQVNHEKIGFWLEFLDTSIYRLIVLKRDSHTGLNCVIEFVIIALVLVLRSQSFGLSNLCTSEVDIRANSGVVITDYFNQLLTHVV